MRARFDRARHRCAPRRQRRTPVQPDRLGAAGPGRAARAAPAHRRDGARRRTRRPPPSSSWSPACWRWCSRRPTAPPTPRSRACWWRCSTSCRARNSPARSAPAAPPPSPPAATTRARQQQWLHLIESQERCFQVFADFSDPQLGRALATRAVGGRAGRTERLRRIGCAAPAGGARHRAEPALVRLLHAPHRRDAVASRSAWPPTCASCAKHKIAQARTELQAHERCWPRCRTTNGRRASSSAGSRRRRGADPTAAGRRRTAANSNARSWTWCRSSRGACRP